MYGTPGAVYIDLPADLIYAKIDEREINYLPVVRPLPQPQVPQELIGQALTLLKGAKSPLVIVGKGVAYGQAENEMREFINKTNLPFLATPMGKGVVKDTDPHSVGPVRTFVLKNADVIFLVGARLNWILHFGEAPRFNKDVKIIQLDNDPHEFNTNKESAVCLLGDAKNTLAQLNQAVREEILPSSAPWWQALKQGVEKNVKLAEELTNDRKLPMNYYSVLKLVEDAIHSQKDDYIIVSEGSNTMDIGRTILTNDSARQRMDAATFGTMGVGFGFAIAAQALFPKKKIVMVVGDSAFGFSAMELETAARYNLPLKVIIVNNNGILFGNESIDKSNPASIPVFALSIEAKYEQISEAFGGKGAMVKDHTSLSAKLHEMLNDNNIWVLNVMIDPAGGRKPQEFAWLTRDQEKEDKAKL